PAPVPSPQALAPPVAAATDPTPPPPNATAPRVRGLGALYRRWPTVRVAVSAHCANGGHGRRTARHRSRCSAVCGRDKTYAHELAHGLGTDVPPVPNRAPAHDLH